MGNPLNISIQPVEIAGEHWICISVDSNWLEDRGSVPNSRHSWSYGAPVQADI